MKKLLPAALPFLILAGFIAFVFSKDKQFRSDCAPSSESLQPVPGDQSGEL
jgi:hypothetical protein